MSQARWQALWLNHSRRRGWLACLLWPISLVYGALMAIRRYLYGVGLKKSHKVDAPVIVVGNVVVGGAGKTPTVIALVEHLRARGWRPGVVSRGHGRHSGLVVNVRPDTALSESGDEPALIHLSTGVPVFVSANRVAAARALLLAHPEVDIIVSDDGLQHLALQRDLEIVVFDDRGTGNGWLLPAGLLRESWPRAPASATLPGLVLHHRRENAPTPPLASAPGAQVYGAVRCLASHAVGPDGERVSLHQLRGPNVMAVAGIARPAVFFDMLRSAGVVPVREVGLPDHAAPHDYAGLMQEPMATLLCTEKDAVKIFPMFTRMREGQRPQVWAVPLELTPDAGFFQALDEQLGALKRSI